MSSIWLILKYLPQLIQFAIKLEEIGEDQIINYQVKKSNNKIDLIFEKQKEKTNAENAQAINDLFMRK